MYSLLVRLHCSYACDEFLCAICVADFGVARVLDRTAVAKSFCGEFFLPLPPHLPPSHLPNKPNHLLTLPLSRHPTIHGSRAIPKLPWSSVKPTWSRGVVCVCVCVCVCVYLSLCVCVCVRLISFLPGYRYDHKCDVWSIGCILWDMANSTDTFVYVSAPPFLDSPSGL